MARHIRFVSDDDDGQALFAIELPDDFEHFVGGFGVEVAGGLIRQQQGGTVHQRAGNCHALLLTARELIGHAVPQGGQADLVQHFLRSLACCGARLAGIQQGQGHVFQHVHALQEIETLKDKTNGAVAHLGVLGCAQAGHVLSIKPVMATVSAIEQPEQIHQGAFARSARTHQSHVVTLTDLQGDVKQDRRDDVAGSIALADARELDQAHFFTGGSTVRVMTSSPAFRSPLISSVKRVLAMPIVTSCSLGSCLSPTV